LLVKDQPFASAISAPWRLLADESATSPQSSQWLDNLKLQDNLFVPICFESEEVNSMLGGWPIDK
jgi:hypothetical protein